MCGVATIKAGRPTVEKTWSCFNHDRESESWLRGAYIDREPTKLSNSLLEGGISATWHEAERKKQHRRNKYSKLSAQIWQTWGWTLGEFSLAPWSWTLNKETLRYHESECLTAWWWHNKGRPCFMCCAAPDQARKHARGWSSTWYNLIVVGFLMIF